MNIKGWFWLNKIKIKNIDFDSLQKIFTSGKGEFYIDKQKVNLYKFFEKEDIPGKKCVLHRLSDIEPIDNVLWPSSMIVDTFGRARGVCCTLCQKFKGNI